MPPTQLRIPKERRIGFAKLLGLKKPAFQLLVRVLEDVPLTYGNTQLLTQLASTFSTRSKVSESDATEIFRSIIPLYALQGEGPATTAVDFAKEIGVALERSGHAETDFTGQNREILQDRLVTILNVNAVRTALKASSVLMDHEHVFYSARIFTDIRPVFGDNPREPPAAAVIVNMLRIIYYEDKQQKEFFVGLDSSDLQKLISVLERAVTKNESAISLIKNSNIPYVESA